MALVLLFVSLRFFLFFVIVGMHAMLLECLLFLLHHKQPFEETNENTFLLSTHKVYLKHKKQTQIHVVSSE